MRYTALALACASLAACSNTRTSPPANGRPADVINVRLTEGTFRATQAQVDDVAVEPGRLVFPASARDVLGWKVGGRVIGDRRSGSAGSNAFGYLRKVMAIREEGGQIIVDTQPAKLEEVFDGQVKITVDPSDVAPVDLTGIDVKQYFPDYHPGPGTAWVNPPDGSSTMGLGSQAQGLALGVQSEEASGVGILHQAIHDSVDTRQTFIQSGTLHLVDFTGGKVRHKAAGKINLTISGTVDFKTDFDFRPYFGLAFETTRATLDKFEVSAGGSLSLKSAVDIAINVAVGPGTEPIETVDLATLLANGPETSPAIEWEIAKSKPVAGPVIYGVPTTFQLVLVADCGYGIQGSMIGHAEAGISATNVKFGANYYGKSYAKDNNKTRGWDKYADFTLTPSASASVISGGGVKVECGVTPRIDWLVADLGGPYLGIRGAVNAIATVGESCDPLAPNSGAPDVNTKMAINAYREVQVGGKIDLWVAGNVEVGPWAFAHEDYSDLWVKTYSFPKKGIGYCLADCANGKKSGNETDLDCGANCNPCVTGKTCGVDEDCKTGFCAAGVCAATACQDLIRDNNETDVDCGGGCSPCVQGKSCGKGKDCSSGYCNVGTHVCVAGACFDGLANGTESDLDCGGACAQRCTDAKKCNVAGDCESKICNASTKLCIGDYCSDNIRSGAEPDVDCGGVCVAKCTLGRHCGSGGDCASGICSAAGLCVASTCQDGRLDGGEVAIDCGAVCPTKCASGQACKAGADCAASVCSVSTKTCAANTCSNGALDAGETAVDCGGASCGKCALGKRCNAATDCFSGFCSSSLVCVASQCADGQKDGSESDVDCGSGCQTKCGANKVCNVNADCKSLVCGTNGRCAPDRCLDLIKNGTESDVDCGGVCSAKCATGKSCNAAADCASTWCNLTTRKCVATHCEDGSKDASETDVDCGGNPVTGGCAADCTNGQRCGVDADCLSAVCNSTTLVCGADHCDSGRIDGGETDLDCGGPCSVADGNHPAKKCRGGKVCTINNDCIINACDVGLCRIDPCDDGLKNNLETDVDCGGATCAKCGTNKACSLDSDCLNPPNLCRAQAPFTCQTQCADARKNGIGASAETGVDCGGALCSKCGNGQGCNSTADCASGFCNLGSHVCVDHCGDGVANTGLEPDVDCGQNCTTKCAVTQLCDVNADCASNFCELSAHRCQPSYHSCLELFNAGYATDGQYFIQHKKTVGGPDESVPVFCKMTPFNHGGSVPPLSWTMGGWTLAMVKNSMDNQAVVSLFGTQYLDATGALSGDPAATSSASPATPGAYGTLNLLSGMAYTQVLLTAYQYGAEPPDPSTSGYTTAAICDAMSPYDPVIGPQPLVPASQAAQNKFTCTYPVPEMDMVWDGWQTKAGVTKGVFGGVPTFFGRGNLLYEDRHFSSLYYTCVGDAAWFAWKDAFGQGRCGSGTWNAKTDGGPPQLHHIATGLGDFGGYAYSITTQTDYTYGLVACDAGPGAYMNLTYDGYGIDGLPPSAPIYYGTPGAAHAFWVR